MSNTPFRYAYIDDEANAGRMGDRLMAIVAEGQRERVYLSPNEEMEAIARSAHPTWKSDAPSRGTWASNAQGRYYGFRTFGDYFTPRQLLALSTFSDLTQESRAQVKSDAIATGMDNDDKTLNDGGTGATAYADAVGVYLSLAVGKFSDNASALCSWHSGAQHQKIRATFGRQGLTMAWDFAEGNPFSVSTGHFMRQVDLIVEVIGSAFSTKTFCSAQQADAQQQTASTDKLISTDPPYYDNIGYADLSDFFYVWLRRSLKPIFPDLFSTLAVPKAEELCATLYRHGSKEKAETFFLDGMTQAMHRLAELAHPAFPVTIYYAFKQAESDGADGTTNTGWDTFLAALIEAGLAISGTWPMRTELSNRMISSGTNALASSIVLVCRKRDPNATSITRGDFRRRLRDELPTSMKTLQASYIAPVDVAQAAIGPGMAIFSSHAKVVEADGSAMTVRTALQLINEALDEFLTEQEGESDADTRFAITWFEQHQYDPGSFGEAETLAKARNVSVSGVVEAGIIESRAGKVRVLKRAELSDDWDPTKDKRPTVWEATQHLIKRMDEQGEQAAADLLAALGGDTAQKARDLAYRLYTTCERKGWAEEARAYNGLVVAWPELTKLAGKQERKEAAAQRELF